MSQFNGNAADLDINFERNIFTNDVTVKTGEDAVRRALKNLILLKSNEKPFHPEINSGIVDLLFENASPLHVEEIKRRIKETVVRYEPRVDRVKIDMEYDIDRNTVSVKVLYTVRNASRVFTADLTLQRTR